MASDADGVPLGIVSAGANRHDSPLLQPTRQATKTQVGAMPEQVNINLDRGYDSDKLLTELGFTAEIARKGMPAPIQAGKRRVVERAHSRRRPRHTPHADPARDQPLPLGGTPHHTTPEVIHLPVVLKNFSRPARYALCGRRGRLDTGRYTGPGTGACIPVRRASSSRTAQIRPFRQLKVKARRAAVDSDADGG